MVALGASLTWVRAIHRRGAFFLELALGFFAAISVMSLLMIAVNAIPNGRIVNHVRHSLTETNYQIPPSNLGRLDVFTECVAATGGLSTGPGLRVVQRAFLSPTLFNCENARRALDSGQGGGYYWRYWHGYQVISRPVLYFGDIYALRTVTFLLFCSSCWLFVECIGARAGVAYARIALLSLLAIPLYSALFLVDNGLVWVLGFSGASAALAMAQGHKRLFARVHLHFFFGMGMLASFVDMLSAPLLTLSIPLLALYWANAWPGGSGSRPVWVSIVMMATFWLAGYGLCWATKWLIVIAIFNGDVATVTTALSHRIYGGLDGDEAIQPTALMSIVSNLKECQIGIWIVGAFLGVLFWRLPRSGRRHPISPPDLGHGLAGSLLFLLPFVWMAVLQNHSTVHSFFVAQIFYPSFALVLGLIYGIARDIAANREIIDPAAV
jgi:hypothetical protein